VKELQIGQRSDGSDDALHEGYEVAIEAMKNLRVSDDSTEQGKLPIPPPTSELS